ncbi:MAG: 30S ribosomal protein S7, partial [Patescibacteria group bacterium]
MRKRSYYKKREHKSDANYNRVDIGRFINYLMVGGEKTVAEKVFYNALSEIEETAKDDPLKVFEKAMENATPMQE